MSFLSAAEALDRYGVELRTFTQDGVMVAFQRCDDYGRRLALKRVGLFALLELSAPERAATEVAIQFAEEWARQRDEHYMLLDAERLSEVLG